MRLSVVAPTSHTLTSNARRVNTQKTNYPTDWGRSLRRPLSSRMTRWSRQPPGARTGNSVRDDDDNNNKYKRPHNNPHDNALAHTLAHSGTPCHPPHPTNTLAYTPHSHTHARTPRHPLPPPLLGRAERETERDPHRYPGAHTHTRSQYVILDRVRNRPVGRFHRKRIPERERGGGGERDTHTHTRARARSLAVAGLCIIRHRKNGLRSRGIDTENEV